MTLTAVSLFAGVGGFDLAMQRQGIQTVATVEIDKHARKVLTRHFPEARHFEDVTNVTGQQLRDAGFVPESGIITGGFPCQDLSVAGKRSGLAGGRSGLFWEIVRLADELKPRYLVLENVPGLLSSNAGRDFGTVLGALVELGYGVAYSILDAQFFGVPQRRRRVFIVGCLGDDGRTPAQILALPESLRGDFETSTETRQDIDNAVTGRLGSGGPDDNTAQGGHLIADTLRSHPRPGSNSIGAIAPLLLTMREGKDGGGKGPLISEDMSLTLATGNGQVLIQPFVKVIRSGARDEDGELPAEVWAEREVSPTLNAMDNTGDSRATVLTLYKVNRHLGRESTGTASTLTAQMGTGGNNVPVLASQSVVRRLTPVETERLQGFPDGWTEGQTDGHRYKQMGNAVAVPVVEWIMERLVRSAGREGDANA